MVGDIMARRKKPVNKSPYPDYVIEMIARCFWPDIQAYWEREEGQTEFLEWKAEQEKKSSVKITKHSPLQLKKWDVTIICGIPAFLYRLIIPSPV